MDKTIYFSSFKVSKKDSEAIMHLIGHWGVLVHHLGFKDEASLWCHKYILSNDNEQYQVIFKPVSYRSLYVLKVFSQLAKLFTFSVFLPTSQEYKERQRDMKTQWFPTLMLHQNYLKKLENSDSKAESPWHSKAIDPGWGLGLNKFFKEFPT